MARRPARNGRGPALLILYLGWLLVALAGVTAKATAQDESEQGPIVPHKVQRKKDAGPRALAVLRLTANGKTSLVPICILIDGKFWDAAAYKADPVPMALEPGTVYEAERAGNSQGLFTVATVLQNRSANGQPPWLGTGAWVPAGSEKPDTAPKAEAVPVGIDNSEAPPYLTKDPAKNPAKKQPPVASAPSSPSSPSSSSAPSSSSSGQSSGDEPPRLGKPKESPPQEPKPSEDKPKEDKSKQDNAKEDKPGDAKTSARANAPESDSGAGAANRPRLRRGKPIQPLPDDQFPGYDKPGTKSSAGSGPASSGKIIAVADSGVQLIPAISDAQGPDPHSYTFDWLKDEEGERRQQMTALAKDELRAYLNAQAKAKITPVGTPTTQRSASRKAVEPVFENLHMTAYDLWTNNVPVVILSAEAHMPPGASTSSNDLQYSITLVAYPDIYNNLHKLYVGVTDKFHLDLTPRLELVDAVDADGDGRGELVFKETSDQGTGWVIYRASADKLWKMFDSLSPE